MSGSPTHSNDGQVRRNRHTDSGQRTPGSHHEFADLFERYLDAVYNLSDTAASGAGRWRLTRQVANEIHRRKAHHVLDCAAGTGFPGLDLAAIASEFGIESVHTTDGDPDMVRVLRRRAAQLHVAVPNPADDDVDPLLLEWAQLGRVRHSYDYVLCRGNSLAYADTWTGDHHVPSRATVADYLDQIAAKVRPGGFLHVDAPWQADLADREYHPLAPGAPKIWERVRTQSDHRLWQLRFELTSGEQVTFERYSSKLTIGDLAEALEGMGFNETKPVSLPGERPSFGVIIARKVR